MSESIIDHLRRDWELRIVILLISFAMIVTIPVGIVLALTWEGSDE